MNLYVFSYLALVYMCVCMCVCVRVCVCVYVCGGGGVEWCSGIWAGTVSMRECGRFMATRSMIDDLWLDAWMH